MSTVAELYDEAEKLKDGGNHQEAIAKLGELLEIDEAHTLSHLALAVLYGKVGEHDAAIRHGQRACQLDPHDPFNFTAMSVTYQRAWQGTGQRDYIARAEEMMARAHALRGR
jgi:tetratricopeptide (TPR) repeat protein